MFKLFMILFVIHTPLKAHAGRGLTVEEMQNMQGGYNYQRYQYRAPDPTPVPQNLQCTVDSECGYDKQCYHVNYYTSYCIDKQHP